MRKPPSHLRGKQYCPTDFNIGDEVGIDETNKETVFGSVKAINGFSLELELKETKEKRVLELTPDLNKVLRKIPYYYGVSWDRCNHRWRCQGRVNGLQKRLGSKRESYPTDVEYNASLMDQHEVAKAARKEVEEMKAGGTSVEDKWGKKMTEEEIYKVRIKKPKVPKDPKKEEIEEKKA